MIDHLGITASDQFLSYLPLSHIAEQMVSLHGPMRVGACTWFAESIEALGDNLRDVRPNFFLGVPRVWEKIQAAVAAAGAQAPPLRRRIAAWARRKGLEGGYASQRGEALPAFSLKQLLLQPFLAGGVVTVVAPLAVAGWGLPTWTGFCLALVMLAGGAGLLVAQVGRHTEASAPGP